MHSQGLAGDHPPHPPYSLCSRRRQQMDLHPMTSSVFSPCNCVGSSANILFLPNFKLLSPGRVGHCSHGHLVCTQLLSIELTLCP